MKIRLMVCIYALLWEPGRLYNCLLAGPLEMVVMVARGKPVLKWLGLNTRKQ